MNMQPVARSVRSARGVTLLELMIAMAIGLVLLLVVLAMYSSSRQSFRLQDGLGRVQEDGRIAMQLIAEEVRQAGFRAAVWNHPRIGYAPITSASSNGTSGADDVLQLMYMDHENCNGVANTDFDPETGEVMADYKRITFLVSDDDELLMNCDYGANPQSLTSEYSNRVVANGVESFQVLYGVDTDFPPDFSINAWTTRDSIEPAATICIQSQFLCEAVGLLDEVPNGVPTALRIGLLLASPEVVGGNSSPAQFDVLDVTVNAPDDQRLRKVFTSTITLRNLTL